MSVDATSTDSGAGESRSGRALPAQRLKRRFLATRIAVVGLIYAAYIGTFPLLYPVIGDPLGAFAYVPVFLMGLLFGRTAGIIAGVGVLPLGWITYDLQLGNFMGAVFEPFQIVVVGSAMLIGGMAGWMHDLAVQLETHRAALADSTERFELATRTTGDVIWEINMLDGRAWTNQAFGQLVLGTPETCDDSFGPFFSALHPDDLDSTQRKLDAQISGTGTTLRLTFRLRRHDGEYRELESEGVVVRDKAGRAVRVVGSARDVTDRNAAERARHLEMRHKLEMQRVAEMDEFKTQLMNTASHELNTPISAMKLQLHIIRSQLDKGDVGAAQSGFALLERNTARMSSLIRDTLDVARIQSGKLSLQPRQLDLRELMEDVVATYAPVAERDGLEFVSSLPHGLKVYVDADRMAQVMTNLVGNAIKFTPPKGTVRISARPDSNGVVVDVEDTGLGMRPEQVKQLFQPFVRVHDENVVKKGTGLGLYISKAIVDQSGGHIWCDSPGPNAGSTFHVRMPANAYASGSAAEAAMAS